MDSIERILFRLYYPQFNIPNSSRFESLFKKLSNHQNKNSKCVSSEIYPEKIIQGMDKRTSLIIKNIPNYIKKTEIRGLIEKYANINYFALLPDKSNKFLSIVYINVINYKSIVTIYMGLRKLVFNYGNCKYNISIRYSKEQGKEEIKKINTFKSNHNYYLFSNNYFN